MSYQQLSGLTLSILDCCNSHFHNIILLLRISQKYNVFKIACQEGLRLVLYVLLNFWKSLHWRFVRYRIIFKTCTITYQARSCKQPSGLHFKKTCSASIIIVLIDFVVPIVNTRPFVVGAPVHWKVLQMLNRLKILLNSAVIKIHIFTILPIHHSSLA